MTTPNNSLLKYISKFGESYTTDKAIYQVVQIF